MTRRGTRRPRQRVARGASVVGRRYEVEVGPIAHGGHCVARVDLGAGENRVVFVRHALPGERVVVELTEGTEGDRFWRGDAVSVLEPSPDRVTPPCPYAGPGLCGGCDLQHVELSAQRRLKAAVVREQLQRLAGLDVAVDVEHVPNPLVEGVEHVPNPLVEGVEHVPNPLVEGVEHVPNPLVEEVAQRPSRDQGLRWRTRQRYVALPGGRRGMRAHRSHDVIPVEECLLEAPAGPSYSVRGVAFEVADGGFWQVHPGAPEALVSAVLDALDPQPGESALDLYAGVGLFSRFLLDAVGPAGSVLAVEGDAAASALSRTNCPRVEAVAGDVGAVLADRPAEHVDVVVLDPPRTGAKRTVVEQVVARTPRAIAYVACDPAALARDVAIFAEHGYRLSSLRAFDLFPMTHHVECVAHLVKSKPELTFLQ